MRMNDIIFETLWTTKHIKRNYNLPIYHEGYIYGHNGRFMSCIDAASGELVWKSHPPGDGFLIFVDDHLVVLTKKGSLHVVKASPESYQEVAGLQLFDKLVWTPPAFANGKIYARNSFSEMASVDVAKLRADGINRTISKNTMRIPGSTFAKFVDKVETSSGKTAVN